MCVCVHIHDYMLGFTVVDPVHVCVLYVLRVCTHTYTVLQVRLWKAFYTHTNSDKHTFALYDSFILPHWICFVSLCVSVPSSLSLTLVLCPRASYFVSMLLYCKA
jgi:hypothetical protein